jgi:hypothetical protein
MGPITLHSISAAEPSARAFADYLIHNFRNKEGGPSAARIV